MSFVTNLKLKTNSTNDIFYCYFETILYCSSYYVVCYSIYNNESNLLITKSVLEVKENSSADLINLSFKLLSDFLDDCFYLKTKYFLNNPTFFFHNFSYFSSFFIIETLCKQEKYLFKVINRDNTIYKCTISLKIDPTKFLIFRDSFLLMQLPLEKFLTLFNIADNFKTKTLKVDTNFSLLDKKLFKELETNCIHNVKLFQKLFETYQVCIANIFHINLLNNLSLSSLSMDIFRLNFYDKHKYPIEILKGTKETYVRASYMGGITDVYKPVLTNGYHYDINSLYPFVMMNYDMPIGKGKFINNGNEINIDEFFGFLDVTVVFLSFNKESNIPCLPLNDKQKGLICPKGVWRGIYFSEEIKYAKKQGYLIKVHSAIKFNRGKVFYEFINTLYELRLKYKKTSLESIIKLVLNSLYGRFAMQSDSTTTTILDIDDNNTLMSLLFLHEVQSIQYLTNKVIIKHNSKPSLEKLNQLKKDNLLSSNLYNSNLAKYNKLNYFNTAIQLSSAITSYARIEMHKHKISPHYTVFYSDTDSLFTDKPLPDFLVSEKEIGKFKLEGKVKEAFFAAPKLYSLNYEDGRKITKAKGINQGVIDDFHIKQFVVLNNSYLDVQVNRNIRNIKNSGIKNVSSAYNLSGTFYKRKKVFSKSTWVDTKPLYVFQSPFKKL